MLINFIGEQLGVLDVFFLNPTFEYLLFQAHFLQHLLFKLIVVYRDLHIVVVIVIGNKPMLKKEIEVG